MAKVSVIDNLEKVKEFYKRKDIIDALLEQAKGKEIGTCFNMKFYGKRPDILTNEDDVITLANSGVTSFHISEETWSNPMMLNSNSNKKSMDEIRTGWDLILDIDVSNLEHSKACAHHIIKFLEKNDVPVFAKFSGGKGVHLAIPFEAFPTVFNGIETSKLFPDGARFLIDYIRESIRTDFTNYFHKNFDVSKLEDQALREFVASGNDQNKFKDEYYFEGRFNPFKIIEVDTVAVSPRHLYRMLYSVNEKSGLVSVPIQNDKILDFNFSMAEIDNVQADLKFLSRDVKAGSACKLLTQAYDMQIKKILSEEQRKSRVNSEPRDIPKLPEEYFPPCIQKIIGGLIDGKKRSMFILQNFLSNVGYTAEDVDLYLHEWNEKHEEGLRESYIKGQLKHHMKNNQRVLPPNCDNKAYYVDMGFCNPDNTCAKIKNPVTYSLRKGNTYIEDHLKKKKSEKNKKSDSDESVELA